MPMPKPFLLRRLLSSAPQLSSTLLSSVLLLPSHSVSSASCPFEEDASAPTQAKGKWFALPPFVPPLDAASLGKELLGRQTPAEPQPVTALKWVRRCCPDLPMPLVQKLFRIRQVRKEQTSPNESSGVDANIGQGRPRRVSAKDAMKLGEVVLLPVSVQKLTSERTHRSMHDDFEISFVRGLELYKDAAIIVVNKPPGLASQGGVGIRYSMDELAANCLNYEFPEPPRLVHRLDRDSSGVLVLGRTQTSTSILHSLFREKTSGALADDINEQRPLQRKYVALVMGTPRHSRGLISAPLAKIVLEDGKSERIVIADNVKSTSSQHAITEYKVIQPPSCGYTWLELVPLTGRKHQLRVHCADVLGTPIVGDYKYGRRAHLAFKPMPLPDSSMFKCEKLHKEKLPFGLELDGGSISERLPRLHLHCKQMVLPNLSVALQQLQSSTDCDFSKLKKLNLVAPLPSHMQMSWEILSSLL